MAQKQKKGGLWNVLINVIIPATIMSRFSTDQTLGPIVGLVIALLFPISYGLIEWARHKKLNIFSAIGLIGVLMLGSVGLLGLDPMWVAVKETGIPLILGLIILLSQHTKYPAVRVFLIELIDIKKIEKAYEKRGHYGEFELQLRKTSVFLSFAFFLSAFLNYILAVAIVKSPPGSEAFTKELGTMTALSFPVIAIPVFLVILGIILYLLAYIKRDSGLEFEDIFYT